MAETSRRMRVRAFVDTWREAGYEKGETQRFWLALLRDVLGVERPDTVIEFEKQVKSAKGTTNFIDGSMEAAQAQARKAQSRAVAWSFKDPDNYENLQFFYHPDHLGSSSFITNLEGEVVQHIEYVPFGEVFIEERNNVWNTPYLIKP